ncbi:hypothetical protein AAMO2058_000385500 [Amorphochlora amoebiformis]
MILDEICPNVDAQLLTYLKNIVGSVSKKKKKKRRPKAPKSATRSSQPPGRAADGKNKNSQDGKPGEHKGTRPKRKRRTKLYKRRRKKTDGEKAVNKMLGKVPEEDLLTQMISELVKAHIIKKLENPKPLSDFVGDINVLGSHYQKEDIFEAPSMAQLRACVTVYGILPLGEQYVQDVQYKSPNGPTKAMLLVGPKGTGKTLLSRAIAGHTDAIFMDLSPANVEETFKNKEKTAAYIYMCFKVAKKFSQHGKPTVMYIDEAERVWSMPFKDKGSAETKTAFLKFYRPCFKHMRKYLDEAKKSLKPGKSTGRAPRVLIVGNTSAPKHEFGDKKALTDFFGKKGGKIFFTPIPDTSTRLQIWKHYINKTTLNVHVLALNKEFSMSILGHISAGYSAGAIRAAVAITLSESKAMQIHKVLRSGRVSSLTTQDFVSALSKVSCVYKEEYKIFIDFANSVNGEKKRREIKANPEAAAEKIEGKGKGKGKGRNKNNRRR